MHVPVDTSPHPSQSFCGTVPKKDDLTLSLGIGIDFRFGLWELRRKKEEPHVQEFREDTRQTDPLGRTLFFVLREDAFLLHQEGYGIPGDLRVPPSLRAGGHASCRVYGRPCRRVDGRHPDPGHHRHHCPFRGAGSRTGLDPEDTGAKGCRLVDRVLRFRGALETGHALPVELCGSTEAFPGGGFWTCPVRPSGHGNAKGSRGPCHGVLQQLLEEPRGHTGDHPRDRSLL